MKNRILLIGLGNILLRDDGVGARVIRWLEENCSFTPPVEVIDGGTLGLDLLPFFNKNDKVLIVDAVDSGTRAGKIVEIGNDEMPHVLQAKWSVHQIGLPDLLSVLAMANLAPSEICLIGIQPETTDIGLEVSDRIRSEWGRLIDLILTKLEGWGVRCVSQSR